VELVEDPTRESNADSSALTLAMSNVTPTGNKGEGLEISQGESQPLTTSQRQMAAWFNGLPEFRKEMAFIPGVRNSHSLIVCRDVIRFPQLPQRMGLAVIQHKAGHFIL
jgi:hypothetical protein